MCESVCERVCAYVDCWEGGRERPRKTEREKEIERENFKNFKLKLHTDTTVIVCVHMIYSTYCRYLVTMLRVIEDTDLCMEWYKI